MSRRARCCRDGALEIRAAARNIDEVDRCCALIVVADMATASLTVEHSGPLAILLAEIADKLRAVSVEIKTESERAAA